MAVVVATDGGIAARAVPCMAANNAGGRGPPCAARIAAVAAGDIAVVGIAVVTVDGVGFAVVVGGKSAASSVNDFSRHNTST